MTEPPIVGSMSDPEPTSGMSTSGVAVTKVSPLPSEDEVVAIMAGVEALSLR